MPTPISRRSFLKVAAAQGVPLLAAESQSEAAPATIAPHQDGWICGRMSGAQALVEALLLEGTGCVFGIPGAQENELWDAMKSKGLEYLLVTHEFSASTMADGYARSTGCTGVVCIVPGPGLTNALTGLGEALLDSIPMVCIVGDVAAGAKYRPFQVHCLPHADLMRPVTKEVIEVTCVEQIPVAVRQAFYIAQSGEPGPVGVIVPYNLMLEWHKFSCGPLGPPALPFDPAACQHAIGLLSQRKLKVGIYAGLGCMNYTEQLAQVAELLQAPVATSVSGKGVIHEGHPLAVGWGYGAQGTKTAETIFKDVDLVLAIGVRYSEVSTASYAIPKHKHLIQVDINADNLGKIVQPDVCVHSDAGLFLDQVLANADCLRRPANPKLCQRIARLKEADMAKHSKVYAKCGADPMAFLLALRRCIQDDAMVFVDVTMTEHWASEAFQVRLPRTFFNPIDNQSMGWSIPAAIGGQRAFPHRQAVTITGDGCFLMSAMEISTAARAGLPVKFFILDDQSYHYMSELQQSAYMRTTATVLAKLDYAALAQGMGVGYQEILSTCDLESGIRGALMTDGPVLTRIAIDYRKRSVRWIEAVKGQFLDELSTSQKMRLLSRLGSRAMDLSPQND